MTETNGLLLIWEGSLFIVTVMGYTSSE